MSIRLFPRLRGSSALLLTGLLLLGGCESCSSTDDPPPAVSTERASGPRLLATDYLRYAYQGALLNSQHPLNDSLSALTAGAIGGGRTLTVVDTFYVTSVESSGDAEHTVRVRFPRSVDVQSVSWTTSTPTTDAERTIRIREGKVHEAPHVVGSSAFETHLREVAPAAADTVLEQTNKKLKSSPSGAGV